MLSFSSHEIIRHSKEYKIQFSASSDYICSAILASAEVVSREIK